MAAEGSPADKMLAQQESDVSDQDENNVKKAAEAIDRNYTASPYGYPFILDASSGDYDEKAYATARGNAPPVEVAARGGTTKHQFNYNLYATKKSAAEGLLDLALLMANASQLKYILMTEGNHRFYHIMLTLLLLSIIFQIMIGIALLFLARMRLHDKLDDVLFDNGDELDLEAGDNEEGEEEKESIVVLRKYSRKIGAHLARKNRKADFLNNIIVASIFMLTVVNIFISAFGLNETIPPVMQDVSVATSNTSA